MATTIQRSFSGGEISPSLYARVDQVKYQTGLRTCRNFMIARHGGAFNRPGTRFIQEVKDSSKSTRLIEFVFNATQTYIIEVGDLYMRFIRNGAQIVESAKTITGITKADPGVVTSTSHGYSDGDEVYISGVSGMTEINGRNLKVANKTANTFEVTELDGTDLDTSGFTAYTSGGTAEKVYELVTPYAEADIFDLHFIQSADIITITHEDYEPRELARTGHTSWTLTAISVASEQAAPTGLGISGGPAGSKSFTYHLTAVDPETGEESVAATVSTTTADPTVASPHSITYTAGSGATQHNVYLAQDGAVAGFISISDASPYKNEGLIPDVEDTPPINRDPFGADASDDTPSTASYFQQRLMFANSINDPEKVWGSRIGQFKNFNTSTVVQSDDAITFTMSGRQVNSVQHLVDIGKLIVFTTGGEWTADGNESGILEPLSINLRQHSYHGSDKLQPIIIGGTALYVQARGSIIRDIGFDFEADGYRGNDLTVFSAHLFDQYSIVDWSYQQIPNSNVWVVRSDGKLLGLTLVREQQMLAWHRHDFEGGLVKSVASIPGSGNEDETYVVVERTINSKTVKYVERFATRQVDEDAIEDSIFMDSSLSYDGTNTSATTMTISGGSTWAYDELLTLTASTSYFVSGDVGNAIHITDSAGDTIRFTISSYTSGTVVKGFPHKTVPSTLQDTAVTTWGKAVDGLSGLFHLEGEDVSVFADGFVVASPNNASYDTITVSDGQITLDKTYVVVHVGLPYISDIETLNIDTEDGETLLDKNQNIKQVNMSVEASRGVWAGSKPPSDDSVDPLEGLRELKVRSDEGYDDPVSLKTDNIDINIRSEWNSNGRVFIRQVDPLPLSVLSIAPAGDIPFRR